MGIFSPIEIGKLQELQKKLTPFKPNRIAVALTNIISLIIKNNDAAFWTDPKNKALIDEHLAWLDYNTKTLAPPVITDKDLPIAQHLYKTLKWIQANTPKVSSSSSVNVDNSKKPYIHPFKNPQFLENLEFNIKQYQWVNYSEQQAQSILDEIKSLANSIESIVTSNNIGCLYEMYPRIVNSIIKKINGQPILITNPAGCCLTIMSKKDLERFAHFTHNEKRAFYENKAVYRLIFDEIFSVSLTRHTSETSSETILPINVPQLCTLLNGKNLTTITHDDIRKIREAITLYEDKAYPTKSGFLGFIDKLFFEDIKVSVKFIRIDLITTLLRVEAHLNIMLCSRGFPSIQCVYQKVLANTFRTTNFTNIAKQIDTSRKTVDRAISHYEAYKNGKEDLNPKEEAFWDILGRLAKELRNINEKNKAVGIGLTLAACLNAKYSHLRGSFTRPVKNTYLDREGFFKFTERTSIISHPKIENCYGVINQVTAYLVRLVYGSELLNYGHTLGNALQEYRQSSPGSPLSYLFMLLGKQFPQQNFGTYELIQQLNKHQYLLPLMIRLAEKKHPEFLRSDTPENFIKYMINGLKQSLATPPFELLLHPGLLLIHELNDDPNSYLHHLPQDVFSNLLMLFLNKGTLLSPQKVEEVADKLVQTNYTPSMFKPDDGEGSNMRCRTTPKPS